MNELTPRVTNTQRREAEALLRRMSPRSGAAFAIPGVMTIAPSTIMAQPVHSGDAAPTAVQARDDSAREVRASSSTPTPPLQTMSIPPDPRSLEERFEEANLGRAEVEARRRFHARRPGRIAVANLAALGTTILGASLTVGAVMLPLSFGSGSVQLTFATALGVTAGLASLFGIPAAYTLAADRFDARGSYFATFAGFGLAALGAGLINGLLWGSAGPQAGVASSVLTVPLLFVAMSVSYELSASPATEDPREAATRRGPSLLPSIAFTPDGAASLSIAGLL
jgi:hypothetical protein